MKLSELRKARDEKRANLAKIFNEAKTDDGYDFTKVECVADSLGDSTEGAAKSRRVAEIVRERNAELDDLCKQVEEMEAAEKVASDLERDDNTPANPPRHPGREKARKTLGQMIVAHPNFPQLQRGEKNARIEIEDFGLDELKSYRSLLGGRKTLFETSAGWEPESVRSGVVVEDETRPIQVLDIIPSGMTGQAAYVYMEETTRTHSAAERAEGGSYAESEFALTERSKTVRSIGDSVPVTDEQLEDVAQAEGYLDSRLRFGVRQRLDYQILNGDGVAPNLEGINNAGSIQTQAKGADPVPDAIYKAMTKIRVTGRAMPTHVILHPNDWQAIRLLRTTDGVYIWGSPSESGPERVWGLPVVQADSQSENTGLVGSFQSAWIGLFERRGIVVEVGYVGSQFTEGKRTLRASMRAVLVLFRAPAFCQVTGI